MARKARIKSSTGIYHVLVRAISDLSLFTDEEDTHYYTTILNDLQLQGRCQIYAYALFPTHVHLLIREGTSEGVKENSLNSSDSCSKEKQSSSSFLDKPSVSFVAERSSSLAEPIGSIMKRIASAYSYYFNVKYEHYGPIYLDRFKSNPVESRDYFLKVLNHIGSQPTDHKYTTTHLPSLPKVDPTINSQLSILNYSQRPLRITDSRLLAYLQQNYSFTNIGEFLQREIAEQKEVISNCKKVGGSIRQIVRLTGCPYQSVFQIK